jgi:glycosyltransferase involved in cell wall biosynthesis
MAAADRLPWVIVAGGFHDHGGMDRANAALAEHLLDRGVPVHLVGHDIESRLSTHPRAVAHVVPRPQGLPTVAEWLLGRRGIQVASRVTADAPGARVVVNGGNCAWPDVNWVHAVHAAWPVRDDGAPRWSHYRNTRLKATARERERIALGQARVVIANSQATRAALVERLGVDPHRVHVVYLGSDPAWGPVRPEERLAARASLALPADRPVVAFVGALGSDINKGFDILWQAWTQLSGSPQWDARLVVAGSGCRMPRWRDDAARRQLGDSVTFLGFTHDVRTLLAAADLLVSPVRYEAYGLNVHEALCRDVPVLVTRTAGVVERFDPRMTDALLPEHVTADVLAERLRQWRRDVPGWRVRAAATAARLRSRSWREMAAELVSRAHAPAQHLTPGTSHLTPDEGAA